MSLMFSLGVGIWYVTRPKRISALAEVLLSRVLGGQVHVESGHVSLSGTLLLSGVDVRTHDPAAGVAGTVEDQVPIFSAARIEARFDWLSLLSGQLSATQLVADSPVFRPIENRDTGHWNYELLRPAAMVTGADRKPGAGRGAALPVVIVRDAQVEWGEIQQGIYERTGVTPMEGNLTPNDLLASTYDFQFARSDESGGGGDTVRGSWDTATDTFIANAQNIEISDALRNAMPRKISAWFDEHHFSGRLSQLAVTFDPQDGLSVAAELGGVSMVQMVDPEQGIGMGEVRPEYPLDIKNVRGRMEFSLSDPAIRISDMSGEVLGYAFKADCVAHGLSVDAPFELHLRFPGAVLTDHYPPLFTAFLSSQDLLQRVSPRGKMDIAMEIRRTALRGPLLVDGTVDCHDSDMRFAHFPYPMDHMNGRISFDQESVTFHDVRAKADEQDVMITGMTGTTWSNRKIDFKISSDNASFDERMAACLPAKYRAIWDDFSISGKGGFVCTVTRSNSLFELPRVLVDVDLKDGSGYLKSVPYAFDGVTGRLHFESDQTRIENVSMRAGGDRTGRVTINGVVRYPSGDVSHLQPNLDVKADVPIDSALIHALPEAAAGKLAGIALGGRAGFDGNVRLAPGSTGGLTKPGDSLLVDGAVTWNAGSVKGRVGGMDVDVTGIAAAARISPTGIDLEKFAAEVAVPEAAQEATGGAGTQGVGNRVTVSLSGRLSPQFAGDLNISAAGRGISLPRELPGAAPAKWSAMWKAYQPGGKIDLSAEARLRINGNAAAGPDAAVRGANGAGAEKPLFEVGPVAVRDYAVHMSAEDVSVNPSGWPDPLTSLSGNVDIVPGGITMNAMSGQIGSASLHWQGKINPANGAVQLSGGAASQGWPVHLLEKLPAGIAKNVDVGRKDTGLDLQVVSLSRDGADKPWNFDARLDARNVGATGPLPMSAQMATLQGSGHFDPAKIGEGNGVDFSGSIALADMSVSNRMIDTLNANITVDSAAHEITMGDLKGNVAGGQLHGTVYVQTTGSINPATLPATAPDTMPAYGGYRAELTLSDAELSRLALPANAGDDEKKKIGEGRVNASLSLQQTFGPNGDRTGRGELTVEDGKIFNVPLSMGLMQVATLRLPVADSFEQANLSYYLRNDQITFERILLQSKGINLAGLGTLSMKDKVMDLSFVTETPHELFIPILTPIIVETRNELLQLSVTGTLDNPKIVPVPLSAIANTLRNILPHPRADAGK